MIIAYDQQLIIAWSMIIAFDQQLIIAWSMIIAYDQQLIIDHWSTNIIHDQQIYYNCHDQLLIIRYDHWSLPWSTVDHTLWSLIIAMKRLLIIHDVLHNHVMMKVIVTTSIKIPLNKDHKWCEGIWCQALVSQKTLCKIWKDPPPTGVLGENVSRISGSS